ncbi:hypothetical protein [Devosia sp.]|uniref:hypothetical protein n=1 Tax=Devosia sp. TaxID=1871048 RepID=UPI003A8F411B
MASAARTIAILVANPALSSVLNMVLATNPNFRVRTFHSLSAMQTYMRIAAVDMVVADYDCASASADRVAIALRADPGLFASDFQLIALTSAVSPTLGSRSEAAGIDEVIVKPMSPRYLQERVEARLEHGAARVPPMRGSDPIEADFSRYSNVVPLFGHARTQPAH